jgi:hypothetical protein
MYIMGLQTFPSMIDITSTYDIDDVWFRDRKEMKKAGLTDLQMVDLFRDRPVTAFSNEVMTLQDLKLDPSIPSHAFFLVCYMSFKVDADFCRDGSFQHFSSTISLPPGESHPPRMSVL